MEIRKCSGTSKNTSFPSPCSKHFTVPAHTHQFRDLTRILQQPLRWPHYSGPARYAGYPHKSYNGIPGLSRTLSFPFFFIFSRTISLSSVTDKCDLKHMHNLVVIKIQKTSVPTTCHRKTYGKDISGSGPQETKGNPGYSQQDCHEFSIMLLLFPQLSSNVSFSHDFPQIVLRVPYYHMQCKGPNQGHVSKRVPIILSSESLSTARPVAPSNWSSSWSCDLFFAWVWAMVMMYCRVYLLWSHLQQQPAVTFHISNSAWAIFMTILPQMSRLLLSGLPHYLQSVKKAQGHDTTWALPLSAPPIFIITYTLASSSCRLVRFFCSVLSWPMIDCERCFSLGPCLTSMALHHRK